MKSVLASDLKPGMMFRDNIHQGYDKHVYIILSVQKLVMTGILCADDSNRMQVNFLREGKSDIWYPVEDLMFEIIS